MIDNGDAANSVGFRVRRLRLGFEGALMKNVVLELTMDPTHAKHLIHDASITWKANPWPGCRSGCKVCTPGLCLSPPVNSACGSAFRYRRCGDGLSIGSNARGAFLGGALGCGGVYNVLRECRKAERRSALRWTAESSPPPATMRSDDFRFQLGGGAVVEDGPTIDTFAWSGDVHFETGGLRARFEYLYDKRTPKIAPQVSST